MKDFIIENYQFVATLILMVVSLLFVIFRKKVKVQDDIVSNIICMLPSIICKVERTITLEKCGSIKKAKVLDTALSVYKQITGVSLTYDSEIAIRIDKAIEDILCTPQKKDV